MSYCTLQDLIDRFAEHEITRLADRDEDGVADADVIDKALADADAEIDAYLAVRYQLPLIEPYPVRLKSLACDIARYRLQDDNPLDEVTERYKGAIAFLRELANGKAALPGMIQPDTGGLRMAGAKTDDDRVFTAATLSDF
jgi:phage gp36-like protein